MKKLFAIMNLLICFELVVGPNFPGLKIFSAGDARAEDCPSGLTFDATLNRCITSDQAATLMNATSSCNGDKECYKRLAEEKLKEGEADGKIAAPVKSGGGLFNTVIGAAAIAGPLLAAYTVLTVPKACGSTSMYAMTAGGVAQIAGHLMTMGKHKKCLDKIQSDWEKKKAASTETTSSGTTKVSNAQAQSEAFEMLAQSEECMEKTAKTKATFYAISAAAFAVSAVLAGIEMMTPVTDAAATCVTSNKNPFLESDTLIANYKIESKLHSNILESENLASFIVQNEAFMKKTKSCASIERYESIYSSLETKLNQDYDLLADVKYVANGIWNNSNLLLSSSAHAQGEVILGGAGAGAGVAFGGGAAATGAAATGAAATGAAATGAAATGAAATGAAATGAAATGAAATGAAATGAAATGAAATGAAATGAAATGAAATGAAATGAAATGAAATGAAATGAAATGAAATGTAATGAAATGTAATGAAAGGAAATGGIRSFLIKPATRLVLSGILAGWSALMWQHSNKQAKVAKERAEFLRKLKQEFNDSLGAISCTAEERSVPANANCYCYTEAGQRNTARTNSATCQALFNGTSPAAAGSYNTLASTNQKVCISSAGAVDESCSCKQSKSCLNGIPSSIGSLGQGAISVASTGMKPLNDVANGNVAAANINGAAVLQAAARILEQKKKLADKKISPSTQKNMAKAAENALIAGGAGTPSPILNSNPLPMNMSAGDAARALEKELGNARSFENIGGAPSLAQPGASAVDDDGGFKFENPDQPAAPTDADKLAEVMKEDFNYNNNDITKSDSNIFNILSNRYQRSGMRRLFDEDGKSKPEAASKSDIAQ